MMPSSSRDWPWERRETPLITPTDPLTVIASWMVCPDCTVPSDTDASKPPPENLNTTSRAGTPFNSNFPDASTGAETPVPTTWTVIVEANVLGPKPTAPADDLKTPLIVAPDAEGAGADAAGGWASTTAVGAVGEAFSPPHPSADTTATRVVMAHRERMASSKK